MEKMTAVVTGGTGGIGTAICQRLSQDYQVLACYFKGGKHEDAERWQKEQRQMGYDIDIFYADISNFSDCEKLTSIILKKYPSIDILVNNAGVTSDTSLRKMSCDQWREVVDTNLTSVFNVTRNLLPFMLEKGYGRIINVSSINGRKGQFGQCNYAASKAALYGFTKSLAQEVASKGITVNTISPGYIETAMTSVLEKNILQGIINCIPIGRLGSPKEVAEAVAFLAAPSSGFITGANLDINGGQYM